MRRIRLGGRMKIRIVLSLLLIALYGVYLARFKGSATLGGVQLYRISDRLSFGVRPRDKEPDQSITIQGTRPSSRLASLLCGACQVDYSSVDMPQANLVRGDWVYSDYPQHKSATADIVNLRTSEVLDVDVPGNPTAVVDLQTLPAYRERGLLGDPKDKLTVAYVKAHFASLSTDGGACIGVHLVFGISALLLIFPQILIGLIDLIVRANDPNRTLGESIGASLGESIGASLD